MSKTLPLADQNGMTRSPEVTLRGSEYGVRIPALARAAGGERGGEGEMTTGSSPVVNTDHVRSQLLHCFLQTTIQGKQVLCPKTVFPADWELARNVVRCAR